MPSAPPASLLRRARGRRRFFGFRRPFGGRLLCVNDQHLAMAVHTRERLAGDAGEQERGVALDVAHLSDRQTGWVHAVDAGRNELVTIFEVGVERNESELQ